MDIYQLILSIVCFLASTIFFIFTQGAPDSKEDELISKFRLYVAAILLLIFGIVLLIRSIK
jgi:hypothetical protein